MMLLGLFSESKTLSNSIDSTWLSHRWLANGLPQLTGFSGAFLETF